MASILTSLGRTVLAGFVLLVLIIILFGSSNIGNPGWISFVFRYLHVISGVMWIGCCGTLILYKFHRCLRFRMSKNQRLAK